MKDHTTIELPKPVKGSCTKGHEWEYDPRLLSPTHSIQMGDGKAWCLRCIEEKLAEAGVGEVGDWVTDNEASVGWSQSTT